MKNKNCLGVIIPAAGSGNRMGGVYKPLEKVCGKEMLLYSLDTFQKCDEVNFVVIAAREDKVATLEMLCKKPGRVYTREDLLDRIWGTDYVGDTRTVDSHMARLRTKLGSWGDKHLMTIYGTGYKVKE